tara:strand:+ start:1429 stop:1704 length:276 start_codon:yes stop_codon:yes gene_type:complete
MGTLKQGQALIYERVDNVVYARYRDEPYKHIPRWVVGGYPEDVERAKMKEQGDLFTYKDWQEITEMARTNKTLQKTLNKVLDIYLLAKESK